MRLERKLSEWKAAGLLDEATSGKLLAYEINQKQNAKFDNWGRGLLVLGGFAIIIGIISVVSANWALIGDSTKIGVGFLMSVAFAWALAHSIKRAFRPLWIELLTILHFGFAIALIGLVAQIFQLHGDLWQATGLWLVITTPFLFAANPANARQYFVPVIWLIGFVFTVEAWLFDYEDMNAQLALTIQTALTCGVMLAGLLLLRLKDYENWGTSFFRIAAAVVVISASGAQSMWRYHMWGEHLRGMEGGILSVYLPSILVTAGSFIVMGLLVSRQKIIGHVKPFLVFLGASFGFAYVPVVMMAIDLGSLASTGASEGLSALMFCLYWLVILTLAAEAGKIWLLRLSIVVIAARIYIAFLEVFDTLLQTGVGLIVSGLLLIGMVFGVMKLQRRMIRKVQGRA